MFRCLALATCAAAALASFDVYVSTKGIDAPSSGSKLQPFQTIGYAKQQIQTVVRDEAINVWIMGGTYFLPATIEFGPSDSGAFGAPVTYAALPGTGPVVISGGFALDPSLWSPPQSGSAIWTAQLPASVVYFRQLFVNDQRAVMARTPVMEYANVNSTTVFYKPGQLPSVHPHNPADTQLVMYESWTASIHQIAAIDDSLHIVELRQQFDAQWAGGASGYRYYAENFLEALDTPGEFYFDRVSHVLSYIPPEGVNPQQATVIVPQLLQLVTSSGNADANQVVSNINWVNVTFSHADVETASCYDSSCNAQSADFLTTAAINLNAAHNWTFDGVTVSHVGGYGVWSATACSNVLLNGVHMYDLGAGGVRIGVGSSGVEPDETQRNVNTAVVNSVLELGGFIYQEGCGVLAQQVVGINISHNIIRNFSYTGVSIGWTWGYDDTSVYNNYVGYNEISFIGLGLLSDMGCVYTLGHQPGSVIDHNICHDVISFNYGGWGLYTDEGSRDLNYTNNIVYHTKCAGIHQHYGLDNLFKNNVIANVNIGECDGAIRSSPSGGQCTFPAKGPMTACTSFVVDTNIFYAGDSEMFMGTIPTAFDNVTFGSNDYWSTTVGSGFEFPHGDSFSQWQAAGKDKGSVVANPEFTNPGANDYTDLAASSPALAAGFVPISTSSIGPQRSVGAHGSMFTLSQLPEYLEPVTTK